MSIVITLFLFSLPLDFFFFVFFFVNWFKLEETVHKIRICAIIMIYLIAPRRFTSCHSRNMDYAIDLQLYSTQQDKKK